MTISNTGTSGAFSVTNEDMSPGKYHNISKFEITTVKPPQINDGNSASLAMTKWVQPWPDWNFEKISIPLYDGICQFLGVPSNNPDFIKDYHFIGIMRNIDLYLAPTYQGYIYSTATGVASTHPSKINKR